MPLPLAIAVSIVGGAEAATAIVSVTSLTGTGSAHINLLMSGIFDTDVEEEEDDDDDDVKGVTNDVKNVNVGVVAKFEWTNENGTVEAVIEELAVQKVTNVSRSRYTLY